MRTLAQMDGNPAAQAAPLTTVDDVYNHAIVAYAISAAWELGILARLGPGQRPLNIATYARENDLHLASVHGIARALAHADIIELAADGATATAGRLLHDAMAKKGFFYWLTRGCGELFSTMPQVVRNSSRTGGFIKRDYRAVGVAARDAGLSFVDPTFYDLVTRRGLRYGADLGCGSGERLIRLAERDPLFRGVGIDIADGAVALAQEAVADAALSGRITVVRDDAKRLARKPEYLDVDFVACFMMGHDLWPRTSCIESLTAIGAAFPAATDLIMCDTYRSDLAPTDRHPVFTMGFETAHAVMGQMLPSLQEWVEVFAETGWHMSTLIEFELPPYTALMHLTRSV